jgi:hypothetical protein
LIIFVLLTITSAAASALTRSGTRLIYIITLYITAFALSLAAASILTIGGSLHGWQIKFFLASILLGLCAFILGIVSLLLRPKALPSAETSLAPPEASEQHVSTTLSQRSNNNGKKVIGILGVVMGMIIVAFGVSVVACVIWVVYTLVTISW